MIEYACPRCGIAIDAQTHWNQLKTKPDIGDVLICLYCSDIGIVTTTGVRSTEGVERMTMMQQPEIQSALGYAFRFQKERRRR